MNETRTTCPYCGVGCGVVARVEGGTVSVRGMKPILRIWGGFALKARRWVKPQG
jgi:anaerobic selenocysteine-containing dehydrogenase